MALLQAHRGVSSEAPENTLAAFRMSVEQGYDLIEMDPKYTADGKFVILHDRSLKRTARDADGNAVDLKIAEITLAQAQSYEYGSWFSEQFKGEQIPLLSDVLDFAAEHPQIPIKIDNVWETFPDDLRAAFLDEIAARGEKVANIGFTCRTLACLKQAADKFPGAMLHYDGAALDAETLDQVKAIAAGHRLVIWVCYENEMTGWFKGPKANAELCDFVRGYGEVGVWILSKREELERAILECHADVIETTGHLKPEWVVQIEGK
jgi:glycerophosphoryl diester phosphodiesterase